MKFPVTPKSINVLVFSRLTFIYMTNGGVVSVAVIIRKSFLKSSAV